MTVCPVCEAPAQGAVCENCGKELVPPAPINVMKEVLPELETTAIADRALNVQAEVMPDLDRHHADEVAVAPEPVAELEQTALANDTTRTPLSATITCRYCNNVQQTGTICDTCGMKLATFRPPPTAVLAQAAVEPIQCPACGIKGPPGQTCKACGAFVRRPEL